MIDGGAEAFMVPRGRIPDVALGIVRYSMEERIRGERVTHVMSIQKEMQQSAPRWGCGIAPWGPKCNGR